MMFRFFPKFPNFHYLQRALLRQFYFFENLVVNKEKENPYLQSERKVEISILSKKIFFWT